MERKLGHFLKNKRAGTDKLTSRHTAVFSAPVLISLKSNALDENGNILKAYTADGAELQPLISWSGVPDNTKDLVMVIEDIDAPMTTPFVHFIAYGITDENLNEAKIGKNSYSKAEYRGPRPLLAHGTHHYYFQLFALDKKLYFRKPPHKRELLRAIQHHVIARGELIGTYERN